MTRKSQVARQPKTAKVKAKDLAPRHAGSVKGGKKADGTGGGNVAGGWDLTGNKVHA
ncbi:MAG TPA: hypothetical protein VH438_13120 [Gemmatimonadales bacterium]|jgi:hypothetical protein